MAFDRFNRDPEKPLHQINERITCSPVLLVIPDGENKVVTIEEALDLAKQKNLDLVLINDKADTPIVKILDYGKFLYELKKQKSGNKKHTIKVKSVTVKPQISAHDIGWKADKAIEWFKLGDKVQFVVKAPGRMSERLDLINEVYDSFTKLVEEYGKPKEALKKISKIQYATYFFPTGKK
ncbi:translation initiation factor IF-3 [Candidatus Mycoplasma haematohominis]|uniref:Translation initiation factor IF-3 n=1 Tax=Candidatus Mycoplasma haematohominis TaxID=1494318 RepID=A0A478FQI7_9MOLU|nr:translation initiation factor IF-3 [Candidatus Mycoplasma haemohominis]GCE63761.1 translation initiation factor IF-3 [Candidatus Mycoplasma haemohominis]